METSFNVLDQQKRAKLSLLVLDDDQLHQQQKQNIGQHQQWGRSLQTHSYLRQKLSERCQQKRKSLRQLRARSISNKNSIQNRQCTQKKYLKTNKVIQSDKQSLKDILKKLQSKQIKYQRQKSQRYSTIDGYSKLSIINKKSNQQNNKQNSSLHKNVSQKRKLNQLISAEQSLIKYQKIKRPNSRNDSFYVFRDPNLNQTNHERSYSRKRLNEQYYFNDQSVRDDLTRKGQKEYNRTQQKKTRKLMFRKCTQNKQNQSISLIQFPIQTSNKIQFSSLKSSVNIPKKWNQPLMNTKKQLSQIRNQTININIKRSSINIKQQLVNIKNQSMNNKTFQILKQINHFKSIKNIMKSIQNSSKLASQSLRLKKSPLCPYSRVNKLKNDQNSSINQEYNKFLNKQHLNSLNLNKSIDKNNTKLQIRS